MLPTLLSSPETQKKSTRRNSSGGINPAFPERRRKRRFRPAPDSSGPEDHALREARAELQAKNRMHTLFSKGLNVQCSQQPVLASEFARLTAYEKRLSEVVSRLDQGQGVPRSIPGLPTVDLGFVDEQIADIGKDAEAFRQAVASD